METTFYDFSAKAGNGKVVDFRGFEGKPVLIVNTASKCGFTPQYKGLEALHRKYGGQGLVVLAFPCDQFAHQEPGTDSQIMGFCELNYGVSFPVMSKIAVNGNEAHPLFVWLKSRNSILFGSRIRWNFTKFLIGKDGTSVKRYPPTAEPVSLEADIERALAE